MAGSLHVYISTVSIAVKAVTVHESVKHLFLFPHACIHYKYSASDANHENNLKCMSIPFELDIPFNAPITLSLRTAHAQGNYDVSQQL